MKQINIFFLETVFRNKKNLFLFLVVLFSGILSIYTMYFFFIIHSLPSVEQLKTYNPPLVSTVLDKNGRKVGEFFKERRILVPYTEFPKLLVEAFVAAEDGSFFEHKGLNVKAIFRAFLANLRAGKKVQGGSTITQQVARSLLLTSEKTYTRKIKEAILALRIEKTLSKEQILYLYLNQIYLGHGSYGVGLAAETYFRKKVRDLNLEECSLLAGLPQAPSRFSPIYNPKKAKERQNYVLQRMREENYITKEEVQRVNKLDLKVFIRGKYHEKAPYYLETLRQILLEKIEEERLLTGGLTIKAALDLSLQEKSRKYLQEGLRDLDKRQGFRGPLKNLEEPEAIQRFFEKMEEKFIGNKRKFRIIKPLASNLDKNSEAEDISELALKELSPEDIVQAVVEEVDDENKKVLVQLPFKKIGLLPLENMKWARKPDVKVSSKYAFLDKPSRALKKGDVILVKIIRKGIDLEEKEDKLLFEKLSEKNLFKQFVQKSSLEIKNLFEVSLEQKPLVEGAVIALDQKTGEILSLVGGYDFNRSQFNRAYQAARQTGSVFKPLVYLAALDKGFTPATLITDAPVVYNKQEADETLKNKEPENSEAEETQKLWKPDNYGHRFTGDILFRNALIRSMNVPTVKILEKIGINWVIKYARRLGIFSSLNPDYTLALGSSSVTLYEITKVFSILGRGGRAVIPLILHEVLSQNQEKLLDEISLDERFQEQMKPWQEMMEEKRNLFLTQQKEKSGASVEEETSEKVVEKIPPFFFFNKNNSVDDNQLISEKTSYIMTTLLSASIREPQGTGGGARDIRASVAGKTGTTNGYYDAWFIGYSPRIVVGVWVGFDDEKSLGRGESGARAALPIWKNIMKFAEGEQDEEIKEAKGKTEKQLSTEKTKKEEFSVPEGIIFTNIDNEKGKLVSIQSSKIVRQAFVQGTQPQEEAPENIEEDQDFLREDYSQ